MEEQEMEVGDRGGVALWAGRGRDWERVLSFAVVYNYTCTPEPNFLTAIAWTLRLLRSRVFALIRNGLGLIHIYI